MARVTTGKTYSLVVEGPSRREVKVRMADGCARKGWIGAALSFSYLFCKSKKMIKYRTQQNPAKRTKWMVQPVKKLQG